MRSAVIKSLIFLMLLSFFRADAQIQIPAKPDPPRLVNDRANMLSNEERASLESSLVAYSDSTSTQIVIITLNSLDGADIAEFATELGEKWGVGGKNQDNGVVLAVAVDERKMFIATGRGTEVYLTDAVCKRIIENDLKPAFREQNYYAGFTLAVQHMMLRLSGQFEAEETQGGDKQGMPVWLVVVLMVLVFVVLPFMNRGRYHHISGRGMYSPPIWRSGGFGGGSRGGGFGGFGGGSFGGGGAGGSW
jgi:uncharacterized protein